MKQRNERPMEDNRKREQVNKPRKEREKERKNK